MVKRDILHLASLEKPYPSTDDCIKRLRSIAVYQMLHMEISENKFEAIILALGVLEDNLIR